MEHLETIPQTSLPESPRGQQELGVLTAAQPPGMTPAMRTGESPRSVNPNPFSPLLRWTLRAGYHLFLAEKTERGPWGEAETWKPPYGARTSLWRHATLQTPTEGEEAEHESLSSAFPGCDFEPAECFYPFCTPKNADLCTTKLHKVLKSPSQRLTLS